MSPREAASKWVLPHLFAVFILGSSIPHCGSGPCGRDTHPRIAPEVELPKPVFLTEKDRAIQQAACDRLIPFRGVYDRVAPLCYDQSLSDAARDCVQGELVTQPLIEPSPARFVHLVFIHMLTKHLGWRPGSRSRRDMYDGLTKRFLEMKDKLLKTAEDTLLLAMLYRRMTRLIEYIVVYLDERMCGFPLDGEVDASALREYDRQQDVLLDKLGAYRGAYAKTLDHFLVHFGDRSEVPAVEMARGLEEWRRALASADSTSSKRHAAEAIERFEKLAQQTKDKRFANMGLLALGAMTTLRGEPGGLKALEAVDPNAIDHELSWDLGDFLHGLALAPLDPARAIDLLSSISEKQAPEEKKVLRQIHHRAAFHAATLLLKAGNCQEARTVLEELNTETLDKCEGDFGATRW